MAWDLRKPSQVVECFYFLRALKQHIDEGVDESLRIITTKASGGGFSIEFLRKRLDSWRAVTESIASAQDPESGDESESEFANEVKVRSSRKRKRSDYSCLSSEADGRSVAHTGGLSQSCPGTGNADAVAGTSHGEQEDSTFKDAGAERQDNKTRSARSASAESEDETSSDKSLSREEACAKIISIANWREGKKSYVCSTDEARGIASLV